MALREDAKKYPTKSKNRIPFLPNLSASNPPRKSPEIAPTNAAAPIQVTVIGDRCHIPFRTSMAMEIAARSKVAINIPEPKIIIWVLDSRLLIPFSA